MACAHLPWASDILEGLGLGGERTRLLKVCIWCVAHVPFKEDIRQAPREGKDTFSQGLWGDFTEEGNWVGF